ncbi:Uncharacterised protein [Vibrio cholerae]|nr:Uncharacterised protein [Vibrio cholerae]
MNDQEFFTVHHALTINVEPLAEHFTLPSWNNSVIAHAWS